MLSLRGLYHTQHQGDTTIATVNSKLVYNPRGLSPSRERSSTFAAISTYLEGVDTAVDTAVEDENYSRGDQAV